MKCIREGCDRDIWDGVDYCQVHYALQTTTKLTNPKDLIGSDKLPLHLVPDTISIFAATAFLEGALKYGQFNWRIAGVRSSIYISALERHIKKYKNGEDADPKTRVHHLASIIACAGIMLDAELLGKLNDDRPPRAPMSALIDGFEETVVHLKQMFRRHEPYHYTIEDSEWQPESQPKPITTSTTEPPRPKNSVRPAIQRVESPRERAEFVRAMERK